MVGLMIVNRVCTGLPSRAPYSIGCSRKQSAIDGPAHVQHDRDYAHAGSRSPRQWPWARSPREPEGRAAGTRRSTSSGRRSNSTTSRSALSLSNARDAIEDPARFERVSSDGMGWPAASGSAKISLETFIRREVAHSRISARLKRY